MYNPKIFKNSYTEKKEQWYLGGVLSFKKQEQKIKTCTYWIVKWFCETVWLQKWFFFLKVQINTYINSYMEYKNIWDILT